jgi:hypothetical protein
MEDILYGKPLIQRIEFIKKLRNEDPENEIYIFSGERNSKERKIKVYMVPIDLPIYRLKNIRTKSPQRTYIAKKGLKEDFFTVDQEDRAALKAQHELLLGIANSDQFKGANHVKTFQTNGYDRAHPMIMTSNGVLVNGNTRMSALRHLYSVDKVTYSMFERIPIAILPDSFTENDFRELELHLQINPDIKKDYSWISEAIDCKERIEEGVKIDELVKAYDRKKNDPRNPINLIDQLKVADIYLEYIGLKNDYESLETLQFAFWAWSDWRLKNLREIKRVKVIDKTCCELIENREQVGGNLFKRINSMSKSYSDDPSLWDQTVAQLSVDVKNSSIDSTMNSIIGTSESIVSPDINQSKGELIQKQNEELINGQAKLESETLGDVDSAAETIIVESEIISNETTENNSKFSFMDVYEEQNNIGINGETNVTEDLNDLLEKAEDKKVSIISTVMNVISNSDEEKKRTADLNLVYNDAVNINKSITDCINRIDNNDKTFNKLGEAKMELQKAKIQIEKLITLIDSKTT